MFRYLLSILSLLIISPCVANIASSEYVNEMRDNVQAKIDKKADNANYTQNMVLQTDNSGNVIATTVGTDLFADNSIETIHLADGAVTNADLAGMIDITKLNLGTLPTSGKHMMIWNAESNEYVFEKYTTSILPDGYTQLEYIESTGTQYIDTGFIPNQDSRVVTKVRFNSITNREALAFGAGAASNERTFEIYLWDGLLEFNYGNGLTFGSKVSEGDVVSIDFNKNVLVYYINGVSQPTITRPYVNFITPQTLTLFTIHRAVDTKNFLGFYETKVYDNGNLTHDFVPAKRNSDGVIGMYDTVTKTFFTNSGTGNFIAGPEI